MKNGLSPLRENLPNAKEAPVDRRMLPCCLCGRIVKHGAVYGDEVQLAYRAQTVDGLTWVPVRGHAGPHCPDPPPETKEFWADEGFREHYKALRRRREVL